MSSGQKPRRLWRTLCLVCVFFSACVYLPEPVRVRFTHPAEKPLHHPGVWLLIDTRRETLTVMEHESKVKVFNNVAFGSAGVGRKRSRGDNITPRGTFSIGWVNNASKYYRFWGLNYPSLDYAEEGLKNGRISRQQYEAIARAIRLGLTPPQDTALGGQIGIHGTGRGSVAIHRVANWTNGCVAIENDQADELAHWIRPGTIVEIR